MDALMLWLIGTVTGTIVATLILALVNIAVMLQPAAQTDPGPPPVIGTEYADQALRWIIAAENHTIAEACHQARAERLAEIARAKVQL